MNQNIKVPPTGPSPGQGPQEPGSAGQPAIFPSGSYSEEVMSTWGKMFGGQANAQELKLIIDVAIRHAIEEMKRQQEKALEKMKKMRQEQEENQ